MAVSVGALGVCMILAAAPHVPPQFLAVSQFTLAWTHSIEKVRWEEDYNVVRDSHSGQPALRAGQARIRGSAAGMEPPEHAVLQQGWYVYQPPAGPLPPLQLTRSSYTADYQWCVNGSCLPLSALMPNDGNITRLYACQDPAAGDSTE